MVDATGAMGVDATGAVVPDSIPTLAQCWFNVVHYNRPWPAYNLGPV